MDQAIHINWLRYPFSSRLIKIRVSERHHQMTNLHISKTWISLKQRPLEPYLKIVNTFLFSHRLLFHALRWLRYERCEFRQSSTSIAMHSLLPLTLHVLLLNTSIFTGFSAFALRMSFKVSLSWSYDKCIKSKARTQFISGTCSFDNNSL